MRWRTALPVSLAGLLAILPEAQAQKFSFPGTTANSSFGQTIAIGDVSGDGVTDFVGSAPGSGSQVYVVAFSGADGSVLYEVDGLTGYFQQGESIQPLGDYDGDTIPDFLMSSTSSATTSAVFIIDGENGSALHTISAPDGGDYFGKTAFVADMVGDSTPDFIVSDTSNPDGGAIYIINGATRAVVRTILPPVSDSQQDFQATGIIADLTGDSIPDILAASPRLTVGGQAAAGAVYVFNSATGGLVTTITESSPTASALMGNAISIGDVTGDSVPDIAAARGYSSFFPPPFGTTVAARLDVYSGSGFGFVGSIAMPSGESALSWGRFAVSVSDMTGDGRPEIAIGGEGDVYIYNGATRALLDTVGEPFTSSPSGGFGQYLRGLGRDIDGDSRQDFGIGNPTPGQGVSYAFTWAGRAAFATGSTNLGFSTLADPVATGLSFSNLGFNDLVVASVALSGPDQSEFAISTNPSGNTVSPGSSENIGITLVPTSVGTKTATLTVTGTNGSVGTHQITYQAYLGPQPDEDRVAFGALDAIVEISLVTGDRRTVTSLSVGSGTPFVNSGGYGTINDILYDQASGNFIACAGRYLVSVDYDTGDRTLINSTQIVDGQQQLSDKILEMEWESPGVILAFITNFSVSGGRISRIALSDLSASVVASNASWSEFVPDMAMEPDGRLLLSQFTSRSMWRIDPVLNTATSVPITFPSAGGYALCVQPLSGSRVLLGGFGDGYFYDYNTGTGSVADFGDFSFGTPAPPFAWDPVVQAMAVTGAGSVAGYSSYLAAVLSIDTSTGVATVVSRPLTSIGGGPNFPSIWYQDKSGMVFLSGSGSPSFVRDWNEY